MTPPAHPERYKNHRFPGEIISHGIWLYYRFSLSYRDAEERRCQDQAQCDINLSPSPHLEHSPGGQCP